MPRTRNEPNAQTPNNYTIDNGHDALAKSIERAAEICAEKGATLNVTIYNLYQQGGNAIANNYYGIKSDFEADPAEASDS